MTPDEDTPDAAGLEIADVVSDEQGRPLAAMGLGVGELFIRAYFPTAEREIRVATSYFSLHGYELARKELRPDVRLKILVGRHEAGHVVQAIASELNRQLGEARIPLHDAVADLLDRLYDGRFVIRDAGETWHPRHPRGGRARFHCKVYICDEHTAWSGSSNFSASGLGAYGNEEQLSRASSPAEVALFVRRFDRVLAGAVDIIAEVRDSLRAWLDMSTPFEAYLKALQALYARPDFVGGTPPTYFQEAVIERVCDQVARYHGALALVATGLGKTIIGAEVTRRLLPGAGESHVLVLAPGVVKEAWTREIGRRNVRFEFFDTGVAFRALDERQEQPQRLEEHLDQCGPASVIVVDEAHRYRKVLQKQHGVERWNDDHPDAEPRRNLLRERLERAADSGARIVLLTATPFGTTVQDIRGLLSLLPGTAPRGSPHADERGRWCVGRLDQTAGCEVVTILSLIQVLRQARTRGDVTPDGRLFIAMPGGKPAFWPCRLVLHRVKYPLPEENGFCEALQKKAFSGVAVTYDYFDDAQDQPRKGAADISENNAVRAWMSSPLELRRVIRALLDGSAASNVDGASGKPSRKASLTLAERRALLAPLGDRLARLDPAQDLKLARLREILQTHLAKGRKVLVFAERYATAYYLHAELWKHLPGVETTVRGEVEKLKFDLKTPQRRRQVIRSFAPLANPGRRSRAKEDTRVLICTDADGIGLDLQDADAVVNYDLPLSVDELFQRAGRILRMGDRPDRVVEIYTLVPSVEDASTKGAKALETMMERLEQRHGRSGTLVGGCLLPPDEEGDPPAEIPLATAEDIDKLPTWFHPPEDDLQSTPVAEVSHRSVYRNHEKQAAELPQVLMSARGTYLSHPHVFVLVEDARGQPPVAILYNVKTRSLVKRTSTEMLDLLSCSPDEPKAPVSAKEVERAALEAVAAWRVSLPRSDEPDPELVRLCSVYLQPRRADGKGSPRVDGILQGAGSSGRSG